MKKGFVQVLPLLLLAAFAITTLIIANRVQKEGQDIRSQARVDPGTGGFVLPRPPPPSVSRSDQVRSNPPPPPKQPPPPPTQYAPGAGQAAPVQPQTSVPAPSSAGTQYDAPTNRSCGSIVHGQTTCSGISLVRCNNGSFEIVSAIGCLPASTPSVTTPATCTSAAPRCATGYHRVCRVPNWYCDLDAVPPTPLVTTPAPNLATTTPACYEECLAINGSPGECRGLPSCAPATPAPAAGAVPSSAGVTGTGCTAEGQCHAYYQKVCHKDASGIFSLGEACPSSSGGTTPAAPVAVTAPGAGTTATTVTIPPQAVNTTQQASCAACRSNATVPSVICNFICGGTPTPAPERANLMFNGTACSTTVAPGGSYSGPFTRTQCDDLESVARAQARIAQERAVPSVTLSPTPTPAPSPIPRSAASCSQSIGCPAGQSCIPTPYGYYCQATFQACVDAGSSPGECRGLPTRPANAIEPSLTPKPAQYTSLDDCINHIQTGAVSVRTCFSLFPPTSTVTPAPIALAPTVSPTPYIVNVSNGSTCFGSSSIRCTCQVKGFSVLLSPGESCPVESGNPNFCPADSNVSACSCANGTTANPGAPCSGSQVDIIYFKDNSPARNIKYYGAIPAGVVLSPNGEPDKSICPQDSNVVSCECSNGKAPSPGGSCGSGATVQLVHFKEGKGTTASYDNYAIGNVRLQPSVPTGKEIWGGLVQWGDRTRALLTARDKLPAGTFLGLGLYQALDFVTFGGVSFTQDAAVRYAECNAQANAGLRPEGCGGQTVFAGVAGTTFVDAILAPFGITQKAAKEIGYTLGTIPRPQALVAHMKDIGEIVKLTADNPEVRQYLAALEEKGLTLRKNPATGLFEEIPLPPTGNPRLQQQGNFAFYQEKGGAAAENVQAVVGGFEQGEKTIVIEGAAGTGKTTIAQGVAEDMTTKYGANTVFTTPQTAQTFGAQAVTDRTGNVFQPYAKIKEVAASAKPDQPVFIVIDELTQSGAPNPAIWKPLLDNPNVRFILITHDVNSPATQAWVGFFSQASPQGLPVLPLGK